MVLLICCVIGIMIKNKNEEIMIPSDAIRIRIIANSNSISDLYEKKKLKEEIENDIYNIIGNARSVNEARFSIKNNMDKITYITSNYGKYIATKEKFERAGINIEYFKFEFEEPN